MIKLNFFSNYRHKQIIAAEEQEPSSARYSTTALLY